MFTVMHQCDGTETLYKAPQVQYIGPLANSGPGGLHLLCGPDEAVDGVRARTLAGGVAFVMNDHGATVARYDLNFVPHAASQAA